MVLAPGQWVHASVVEIWSDYVYLVDVRAENTRLQGELDTLALELIRLREDAREVDRLRALLGFTPPEGWRFRGARVVSQRLGPQAVLETVAIDKGSVDGVVASMPVVTHQGVVGRILRYGPISASVLVISDLNSKVAVLGQQSRTTGILRGTGSAKSLSLLYVPQNAPLVVGEVLVTSGLAGIYPKGLPVARITSISRSDLSLFQTVTAEPLVDLKDLEEVLLLLPPEPVFGPGGGPGAWNATAGTTAANGTVGTNGTNGTGAPSDAPSGADLLGGG